MPFRYVAELRVHPDTESPGYSIGSVLLQDKEVTHLEKTFCGTRGPWVMVATPTLVKWTFHWVFLGGLRYPRSALEVSQLTCIKPIKF